MPDLKRTPLYDLHVSLGAKLVPFAGYEMPVQYGLGVMKEHLWTREHAGLFDVSHMGQVRITPKSGDISDAAGAFETLGARQHPRAERGSSALCDVYQRSGRYP